MILSVESFLIFVSYFRRGSELKDGKIVTLCSLLEIESLFLKLYFALEITNMVICISRQDFQCRATLQELNAIPLVLDLLKSEYPIIQLLALKTLGVITSGKKSQAMLRDNQGLDHLIKILETKVMIIHSLWGAHLS